jgi:hypothetical protein
MDSNQKIEYLKSVLKKTLELYYKEKSKPRGLFKKRPDPAIFKGQDGFNDAGFITKAELAADGMYCIGDGVWEHENGEVTKVVIDM